MVSTPTGSLERRTHPDYPQVMSWIVISPWPLRLQLNKTVSQDDRIQISDVLMYGRERLHLEAPTLKLMGENLGGCTEVEPSPKLWVGKILKLLSFAKGPSM